MSVAEKLNNAIYGLDRAAQDVRVTPGVRRAIGTLADAWERFWESRSVLPLPDAKLLRFHVWYARAYLLLPPAVQARCVNPTAIDASFATQLRDELRTTMEALSASVRAASDAGESAGEWAERQGARLKAGIEDEFGRVHAALQRDFLLAALVLGALWLVDRHYN